MYMASFEVHPSRKVSLDKCSHQGSAHWQQYALHGAPSNRGSHPRGGVPCAVMGCLPPIGWHTKGDTMFMEVAKKMPHHEATLLTHMTTSSGVESLVTVQFVNWHPAANVHSLDGYTCKGTPSLMDGPQIKQTISSGATSSCMEAPASAVELSSCRGCRAVELTA